jgi:hypothetical protein
VDELVDEGNPFEADVVPGSGCTSLRFPVDKTPEFGYMGWKQLTQATRLTVRKDRKIKGFQLTR